MNDRISKDRQDALRQGRDDLDTTEQNPDDHTAEEQVRGERHGTPPRAPEKRKPTNG